MRASRVNTDVAQRIRQVVVLFILILAGIIATISAEAKDHTINGDHDHRKKTNQDVCQSLLHHGGKKK